MKISYNKQEIIAAAKYIVENNPSSKNPSHIPHTDRGVEAVRGFVNVILENIRRLAKENEKVFDAVQKSLAAGNPNVDSIWSKWVEVLGIGGYWIIANMEGDSMNFSIAVSPYFGEYSITAEEV